jgi:transposase IS116/IS110/IS902 family protein
MHRLPEAWLAPAQVRELRELVRYRAKLVALRSGLKAQVHAVLAKEGVLVPMSDLFGVAGARLLDELRLGPAYALRVASLPSLITAYDREITMLGREISTALAGDVGYLAIQTIPGVGPVLAAVFVAEIGDVHRFAGAPPLCSWAGLTPRHRESDTTVGRGPSPNRAQGWSAGPRSRPCSGSLEEASRPPTSTASPTGAAPASAASPPPASCSPWSTTAYATARCAAWPRRQGRRYERLGRSRARARVCHDPRLAAWSPV